MGPDSYKVIIKNSRQGNLLGATWPAGLMVLPDAFLVTYGVYDRSMRVVRLDRRKLMQTLQSPLPANWKGLHADATVVVRCVVLSVLMCGLELCETMSMTIHPLSLSATPSGILTPNLFADFHDCFVVAYCAGSQIRRVRSILRSGCGTTCIYTQEHPLQPQQST